MMLSKKQCKAQIQYWSENGVEKFKTMESLYRGRHYADCLFFAHLILEMSLKALVVQKISDYSPKIHNLPRLAELACLNLESSETDLLAQVSHFNMRTRYPDDKLNFFKKCDKKFTDKYYFEVKKLYKKLCQLTK